MSQPASLGDSSIALRQCLVREAETEKDIPQIRLRYHVGMDPGLMGKRVMGDRIIKLEPLFQMRS